MKFRTILLASAAVMFAGSAMAADLTNPFYLPGQGKFASDTTVDYSRTKLELRRLVTVLMTILPFSVVSAMISTLKASTTTTITLTMKLVLLTI